MVSTFFSKIKNFALAHKIISAIIIIAVLWGGYEVYAAMNKTASVTKYIVETASQGTVISDVTGSGQVQAATTIDVKPQVSETVTKIYVQPGDHVTAGEALMQLDTTNEQQALTQAQISMQSAQLALEKLNEAPATTTLESDQDAVTQAQQALVTDSSTLETDYQSGFDSVAAAFIDFQNVMTGLQDFVTGYDINKTQQNPDAYVDLMPTYLTADTQPYATALFAQYNGAEIAYQQTLADYHAATRNSSPATLAALYKETENTAKTISDTVKAGKDLLNYVVNNYPTGVGLAPLPTITTTYQTDLSNYTTTVNGDISNVQNTVNTIANDQNTITNDTLSLQEKQEALTSLEAGPDPLDVQSQNLSIEQEQLALQTAQQNLADDTVRAPISGTIATLPAVIGASVPSPAATIVSDGEIAQVTLNELNAAKVTLGDKATLTFDAFPNLTLAGTIVELDPVGTVSAGVVNYNVQIGFSQPADTSSTNMVKPGMSVTADIVTQVDQNVIAVPNAAVHTSGTGTSGAASKYILEPAIPVASSNVSLSSSGGILLPGGTKEVPVTVGIANDTLTEITSGVNVGDQIITQSITTSATTAKTTTTGTSALSALTGGTRTAGAGATGGGFTRGGGGAGIP